MAAGVTGSGDRDMRDFFSAYDVNDTTWFCLSSLLVVAVFFRFGRIWSLRNLDVVLLLSLTPGLLMVEPDRLGIDLASQPERYGFLRTLGTSWLFAGAGLVLVRLLCDSLFRRRPLIEPNLAAQGLVFLAISSFAFLMAKVVVDPPSSSAVAAVTSGEKVLRRETVSEASGGPASTAAGAAATAVLEKLAPTRSGRRDSDRIHEVAARAIPVLAHLAVVIGLYLVGRLHFGDRRQGVAMATLYLLLPCTSYDVGEVEHVLPAACCIWAFVAVRRPLLAGLLMGVACGSLELLPVFLFLLPLWFVFYERKRGLLFVLSLIVVGVSLQVSVLALTSTDVPELSGRLRAAVDSVLSEYGGESIEAGGGGSWGVWNPANLFYRIPVFAAFVVLLCVLTIWPRQKTLEHLISHTAALVVATQFWYSHQGGVFVLWYVPLLLLAVFRPRLSPVLGRGSGDAGVGWYEPIGSHVPVGTGLGRGTTRP
jgi:hypothetical protein